MYRSNSVANGSTCRVIPGAGGEPRLCGHVRLLGQVALGLDRSHAPAPRRGDGLTIREVLDVAGGEDAGDGGARGSRLHFHVAVREQLDLAAGVNVEIKLA